MGPRKDPKIGLERPTIAPKARLGTSWHASEGKATQGEASQCEARRHDATKGGDAHPARLLR